MPAMAQTFDSSKEYYLRNVQTGMFMKIGGKWGETAALDVAAHPFKFVKNTDNVTYAIQHQSVWISSDGLGQIDDAFYSKWRIEAVTGTQDQYYLIGSNMSAITAQASEYSMELLLEPFNAADNRQKWEILTASGFVAAGKISNASASNPINLTHLIKGASFDYAEHSVLKSYWATTVYNHGGSVSTKDAWCHEPFAMQVRPGFGGEPDDDNPTPDVYNGCFNAANNIWNRFSITQTTEVSLPAGNYVFSFEGFNRRALNEYDDWYSSGSTPNVTVQLLAGNNNLGSPAILTKITGQKASELGLTHDIIAGNVRTRGRITSEIFRDNDDYLHEIKFSIQTPTTLTINITKEETVANNSSREDRKYTDDDYTLVTKYQNLIAMDNFTLLYLGKSATDVDETNSYWERLRAADQNYKAIMDSWKTADDVYGVTSYCSGKYTDKVNSDKLVIGESAPAKINNNVVDTEAEFNTAMTTLRNAYAAALAAHSQHLATRIINPTFNFGTFGWNGVFRVLTENGDNVASSDYSSIKQTIYPTPDEPTMSNGLYKLTAQVTSPNAGNTVYLTGNGYQKGYVIATANTFVDAELYFLVEDGSATIGVVGGSGAGNSLYYPWDGCAFKADDFAMVRVCDVEPGKLKLALLDAEDVVNCTDATRYSDAVKQQIQTKLTEKFGQNYGTLIATGFKNYTGTATAKDVYVILQEAVKTQVTAGSDMTYALMNHSFQLGSTDGWTVGASDDTGVKENLNATYTTRGVDGRYLFNTWRIGKPLTQTAKNLPTGKYKLDVMIASGDKDNDATTYLLADGDDSNDPGYKGFNPPSRGKTFVDASYEFYVMTGSATVGVVGGKDDDSENSPLGTYDENGHWWYKADNFRLTLVEPAVLDLSDKIDLNSQIQNTRTYDPFIWINVNRTIKASSWSTLVLPFNMPIPEGWEVKKLSTTNKPVHNDGNITLRFDTVQSIKAGVPYMVRVDEQCTAIMASPASLNTLLQEPSESTSCGTYKVTFVGSYAPGNLPVTEEGTAEYFFVSGNKFYRSTGPNNRMKAFRAYFKIEPNSPNAPALRSLSMRIGDETIIESVEDEETVVGIYNVNGVKLDSMQPGINILRMNNGTTKKVIIK